MGTHFFWFYDLLLIGIFLAVVYKCTRQGFAGAIVNFIGFLLAFVIALTLSAPIAAFVYDSWVAPGVIEKISYNENIEVPNSVNLAFSTLRSTDMSKATVSGDSIAFLESTLEPDSNGKVTLDLSDVDLSRTGIEDGDLSFFGLDAGADFHGVNLGRVDINTSELTANDLETIVLARSVSQAIAVKAGVNYEQLNDILGDTIPGFSKIASGSVDLVTMLLVSIINSDSVSLEETINQNIVRPVVIIPFRVLIFVIIFAIISIVVSIIVKATRIVNGIPVVGKVNTLLGTALGAVQAVVIILVVCIGVKMLISLTGDSIIFLNTMTIEKTFVFKYLYIVGQF